MWCHINSGPQWKPLFLTIFEILILVITSELLHSYYPMKEGYLQPRILYVKLLSTFSENHPKQIHAKRSVFVNIIRD